MGRRKMRHRPGDLLRETGRKHGDFGAKGQDRNESLIHFLEARGMKRNTDFLVDNRNTTGVRRANEHHGTWIRSKDVDHVGCVAFQILAASVVVALQKIEDQFSRIAADQLARRGPRAHCAYCQLAPGRERSCKCG